MKQRVKQIPKTPGLGECAPFEQLVECRLRAAFLVNSRKVVVIDLEERRRPRLEPVRAAAGVVDSSQQVENENGFASLKQTVLLVESKWDSRPPQVFCNFRAVAVAPGKDENVPCCNLARRLSFITNLNCVIGFRNDSTYRLRYS